jgi:hypothetical protein
MPIEPMIVLICADKCLITFVAANAVFFNIEKSKKVPHWSWTVAVRLPSYRTKSLGLMIALE